MNEERRMRKYFLFLIGMLCSFGFGVAQERGEDTLSIRCAREALDDIVNTRGEILYAKMDEAMQASLSVDKLNSLWSGLLGQFGTCMNERGEEWECRVQNGLQIVSCRIPFSGKLDVAYQAALQNRKISGLYFRPLLPREDRDSAAVPVSCREKKVTVGTPSFPLPGILTLPEDSSKAVPCVLFVHGSGPQNKDEQIGENRPFRDLAYALAAKGVASLRYDKRTFAHRTADVFSGKGANLDGEVIEDALAALHWLRSQKGVDSTRLFVAGHSLGGMLAPRIARRDGDLAGLILLAAPARPFDVLMLEQMEYMDSLSPSESGKQQIREIRRQFCSVRAASGMKIPEEVDVPMSSLASDTVPSMLWGVPLAYWQEILSCNPVQEALSVRTPILVLQGEKDYQVRMTDFRLWESALQGKVPHAAFISYPMLNHLFMESAGTPSPQDYFVPRTVQSCVAEDMAEWIIALPYPGQ